jgi:hypothetical protein
MDILTALTLLNQLLTQGQALGRLTAQAQAEGREITAAEIDALADLDDTARASLQDAIARAKAQGR